MPHTELIRLRPNGLTRWERMRDAVRSIVLSPLSIKDPALAKYFQVGAPVSSGVAVSEQTSLNIAAVWDAVNLIAGDIAKSPLALYRRLNDRGGKEQFRSHSLYRLVHDDPNPEMSSFVARRTMQGHALIWGNAYAEIERDALGRPVAFWPLVPSSVQVDRGSEGIRYKVRNPLSNVDVIIPAADMLHLSGLGEDGIVGYTLARQARESLGLSIAAERFGATFFGNGATFGGIIKFPPGTTASGSTKKEFVDAINKRHQGPANAHRFLALYEGGDYVPLGVPPEAAQFLETRKFQVEEICRWFNIPPHKLKNLDRATNNNIEHQGIEYVTDTLVPWMVLWEQELNRKLIRPLERRSQFFEHITEGLLRGDSQARSEFYSKQFSVGGITVNENRNLENKNPIDVSDADMPFVPLNVIPLDLARPYWQSTIDERAAKIKAALNPPQPVAPVAPAKGDDEETQALKTALQEARTQAETVTREAVLLKAEHAKDLLEQERQFTADREHAADVERELKDNIRALTEDVGRWTVLANERDVEAKRQKQQREDADRDLAASALQVQGLRMEVESLSKTLADERLARAADVEKVRILTTEMWIALRGAIMERLRYLIQRESERAVKAAGRPDRFKSWVETFYAGHREFCLSELRPLMRAWGVLKGENGAALTAQLVGEIILTSESEMRTILADEDPAASLAVLVRRWEQERATALFDKLDRSSAHG